jgi:hypothetical protein
MDSNSLAERSEKVGWVETRREENNELENMEIDPAPSCNSINASRETIRLVLAVHFGLIPPRYCERRGYFFFWGVDVPLPYLLVSCQVRRT